MKPNILGDRMVCAYFFLAALLLLTVAAASAQEPCLELPPAAGSGSCSPCQWLCLSLLGGLFGAGGQLLRAAVGFKEEIERSNPPSSSGPSQTNPQPQPGPSLSVAPAANPPAAPAAPTSTPPARWTKWFDPVQFWISIGLGLVAGAAAAITMSEPTIGKSFVVTCAAAGYAGSDFLEGLISKGASPPKAAAAS
jgi:hypothetical protein